METKPWLPHYPKEVPPHCEYPQHNLARFLLDTTNKYPHQTALYFFGKTMTYEKLLADCTRFANALRAAGLQAGDRVAVMLPNCPQAVIAYYGILMAGGIVVETNPLYTERELEAHLLDAEADTIVILDLLFPRLDRVRPRTNWKTAYVTALADYLPFPKNTLFSVKQRMTGRTPHISYNSSIKSFKKALAQASTAPVDLDGASAGDDIAILQYTGGTTGKPKGVMLTHANLVANTLQAANWSYRIEWGKERYLAVLPFFHVFGMTVLMNQSIYTGGQLILLPKFDVDQVLKLIPKLRPTIFPGAPTMYIALINHPDLAKYDLSSIKICVSGSAPLPLEVQERFEAITGGRLIEGYGLTEAAPVTHCNNVWEKRKLGSIGIPMQDTEAKIVHAQTGEPLPVGEIGELAVKGPQVMKGYWHNEQETAAVLHDGWLLTGDLGMMDDEGYFYVMDRKKDIIIAGGFNIYPREIEEVLFEHPGIQDVVAVGIPDKYRGETVKAFLVPKQGATLSEQELEAWCRERLAAYKVPRLFEIRRELPKTFVGKVLRRKLLEEELHKTSGMN